MKTPPVPKLMEFLDRLKGSRIHYNLGHHRDNAIMVQIAVPGERWEVEFFRDGSVEIERFKSDGSIFGEEHLEELFRKYSD
jgi:hypothetical protein